MARGDRRGYKAALPRIRICGCREQPASAAARLRYRFDTGRIADQVPPMIGKPFEALVPKPDADGLDQGGILLPEMLVPLGTRLGFNTRNDAVGFPWATGRWDGSFVPFPRTEAERQASADPRPSLEARYRDRSDYEAKLRAAAVAVAGKDLLLQEDVDALVRDGGGLYDRIMARDPADRSCVHVRRLGAVTAHDWSRAAGDRSSLSRTPDSRCERMARSRWRSLKAASA